MAIIWGEPRKLTPSIMDYFVVAGGGGGGDNAGGGAGGFLYGNSLPIIKNIPYAITVGGGGANGTTTSGLIGTNSSILKGQGYESYSVFFDGTGDYLSVSNSAAFSFGTGDFTIECFLNFSSTAIDKAFVSRYNGWSFRYSSSGIQFANVDTSLIAAAFTPIVGNWVHVAVSRSGTSLRLFINGILSATVTDSTNLDSSNTLYIGRLSASIAWEFSGYISNVRLVKGTALYTANFTPSTDRLTAIPNTSLLTCQSSTIRDNSVNNFTITTTDNARVVATSPFNNNYNYALYNSVYFDGTGDYLSVTYNSNLSLATGDFTIECWAYTNGGIWFTTYMSSGTGIAITGNVYYLSSNGSTWDIANGVSIGTWTTNSWVHFAFVRNGNVFTPYINGVAGTTTTSASNLHMSGQSFGIGDNAQGFTSPIGYISNFRIVRGTAVYTTNFTAPTTLLTAITNTVLLTCQTPGFIDTSSNGFQITKAGDAVVRPMSPFANPYTTTYGAYFDGSNDWLTSPSNSWTTLAGTFTIEFWVSFTSSPPAGAITGVFAAGGFNIYCDGTRITPNIFGTGNIFSSTFLVANIVLGTWYHIAVTRNSSNLMTMWVNGINVGSGTNSSTFTQGVWQIGNSVLQGYVSNFRATNTTVYTSSFTPPTSPLTAISGTSLLTCQNATFIDNSTNNFTITRNGDTITSSFNPLDNLIAYGGGGGGTYNGGTTTAGLSGGSGGAGPSAGSGQGKTAGTGIIGQGYNGGAGWAQDGGGAGGGGGGSGNVGGNAAVNIGGNGGIGSQLYIHDTGHSVYFDGTGDYLTAPANAAFAFGTGDFTIEYWIHPTISDTTNRFLFNGVTGSGQAGSWSVFSNNAGVAFTEVITGEPGASAATSIPLNTWTHIAVTRSGTTLRVFVNGVVVATNASFSNNLNYSGNALRINSNSTGSDGGSAKYVSNLRVVKGTALYTSNFTPSTSPLTAITNTSLLTCQSSTIRDASTNNFAITVNGNAETKRIGPFNVLGTTSYSAYFDGTTDYVTIPTNSAFGYGTGDFTIEFWLYLNSVAADQTIVSNLTSASSTNPHLYFKNTDDRIYYYTANADRITGDVLLIGRWYHVAVTKASNSTRLFVNGVQSGSTYSDTNDYGSTAPLGIGTYWSSGSPFTTSTLNGYISNLRIIKGTALYTANFTPPTSPLTAISGTSVLTCQNTTFVDNSTNNFALTVNGNATPSLNNPFLENTYVAAGGGGTPTSGSNIGIGGLGGGGTPNSSIASIRNGRTNSGSGAGSAGTGGSGAVAIRYSVRFRKTPTTTGSPTIVEYDGYKYYIWTSSGSITFT